MRQFTHPSPVLLPYTSCTLPSFSYVPLVMTTQILET